MTSVSEKGHAKNIANFYKLISYCEGYDTKYHPSKESLKIPQLNALLLVANQKLELVLEKNTLYNNAVNERIIAFKDLKALSTRLVNALETTEASQEKINDAKGFNRKIQGKRVVVVKSTLDSEAPVPNTISVSQLSYDKLIQHFAGLISVLQSEVSYQPNEVDLTIVKLNDKRVDFYVKNQNVVNAHTTISNARIERNTIMYGNDNGLVNVANEVKKYVKSAFGALSPQYAQIKGISISKIR